MPLRLSLIHISEGEQYAFFTRAVLDAIPNLGFFPDVLHCNDWHTAMLPYQVNAKAMSYAKPTAVFMHCLPAFHDLKTTIGKDCLLYTSRCV